jgi:hypothetical protein
MNTFQNYVFVTTLFCLLVALTITAIVLKTTKADSYPPVVDSCPDYWYNSYYDMDSSNNSTSTCGTSQYGCCPDNITAKTDDAGSTCPPSKCYNVKKLGAKTDTCSMEMDFSNYSTCQKQTWAKGCNITWDGITNISSAC